MRSRARSIGCHPSSTAVPVAFRSNRQSSLSLVVALSLLVLLSSLLLDVAPAVANSYLSSYWYYPIVSSADGSGGTRWQTEFSITNPQSFDLSLTLRVAINGRYRNYTLTVPAGETFLYSDFLKQAFDLSGNAAIYLTAEEERNGNRSSDCLRFATSNKVYNTGGGNGTYGQEIPPSDVLEGFLGSYVGYFTGIKCYGSAGVNGYRANIGFWHTGFSDEVVQAKLYDDNGVLRWQKRIEIKRHQPAVVPIKTTVQSGVLVIDPLGEYVDAAFYVSVVDNRSGDGALRSMAKVDPDDLNACGSIIKAQSGYERGPLTREEAALRLHQLVVGEEDQPLEQALAPAHKQRG